MGKTTSNIIEIVNTGTNVIIDAKEKTTSNIIEIVKIVVKKGMHITLKNASSKTTTNLIEIAKIGGKNITIDLTEI
ncbi:hypothetical protein ACFOWU_08175 [Epilithonimonas zeae]|uniref:Uncharacterized protein n=1 Tax=Epilithonimonas zeae TaxID=1416779 RepID=A0A1N6G8M7_9FLAO|nr:hypothetical protein [Epilithonimonas zeae]SIO03834.1 hypothetical protein SAMN05444409_1710 [Epilithonimonas zeae]